METERISLRREGGVFVLEMHNGEDNRFTVPFMNDLNACMEIVEKSKGAAALVTTGTGKFYSNGLDLMGVPESGLTMNEYLRTYSKLIARMTFLSVPTIAAINGHAFAGGWIWAMAHDLRVMRADRGYLCLNEILMKVAIPHGLVRLFAVKVDSTRTLRRIILQGERFAAASAAKLGLIDEAVPLEQVMPRSLVLAEAMKDKCAARVVFKEMKLNMYNPLWSALTAAPLYMNPAYRPQ